MKELVSFQNGVNIVGLPEIVLVVEEKVSVCSTFRLGSYSGRERTKEVLEIKFLKTVL